MTKVLIVNELLPIYKTTDTGEKVVDGRELHGFLQSKQDFSDWIKARVEKYGFVLGDDFSISLGKSSGGRPSNEYILKLDIAKEIAMVENNEQGRAARKYFIEVEKRYNQQSNVDFRQVPTVASISPNLQAAVDHYLNARMDLIENRFLTKPSSEVSQAETLLAILRENSSVLNGDTNRAIQNKIAELLTGRSIPDPISNDEFSQPSDVESNPDERPQWVKEGYGAKTIGFMLGVSASKVGVRAKKAGLQSVEYGSWYEYVRNGRDYKVFIYNEIGKNAAMELLKEEGDKTYG